MIQEIHQEPKGRGTMAHANVETQKFEMQLQNITGCHERFHVNRDDLAKELEKTSMIRRSHWRHEQGLKSLETLKIY